MRIAKIISLLKHKGYIAGTGDGLVSVGGVPASRKVYVLDAKTLAIIKTAVSLDNGHYLIAGLDPNRKYLIMARDYKNEYEPSCYDNVTPAADLSVDEQQELWQMMAQ